jgi:hypothetical protein
MEMARRVHQGRSMRVSLMLAAALSGLIVGASAQVIVAPPPPLATQQREFKGHIPQNAGRIVAIALDAHGSAKYSIDGKKFYRIRKRSEIPEGSIVRTGTTGSTDLFLKRMGATIRVKPRSEIRFEQTEFATKDEHPELKEAVNMTKGKMLAVVHAKVPGSALEIKNAAGNTLTDTVAGGRYSISASTIEDAGPEKLPAGADSDFSPQMTAAIKEQMEFDEIQALAETWSEPAAQHQ